MYLRYIILMIYRCAPDASNCNIFLFPWYNWFTRDETTSRSTVTVKRNGILSDIPVGHKTHILYGFDIDQISTTS